MGKKKIVLFDIDYVIFDVGFFDKNFYKEASKVLKIDEVKLRGKSIEIIVDLVKNEHYLDIDKFINKTLEYFGKKSNKQEVEDILFRETFFKGGIYDEVHDVLLKLENKVDIGIFSQGDPKLQWAKVEQSGFKDYFREDLRYIIKPKKLGFIPSLIKNHKDDNVYLIDDKLNVIQEVKAKMPNAVGIWIKRGRYAENQEYTEGIAPDATVLNLSEIIPIILGSR